jgi:NDP-sugar pyrophosphorylase family protein
MKAIILADRVGHELEPLSKHSCPALLPVAGKPLVEHTLEELAEAGIRQVSVVVSASAERIERAVGDGSRWGLEIDYFLSRGEESPRRLVPRMGLHGDDWHLILRGDVLRSRMIEEFLQRAVQLGGSYVEGRVCGGHAAALLFRRAGECLDRLAWPPATSREPVAAGTLAVLTGNLAPLDSLKDYHAASLHAVSGGFSGILLPGLQQHPGVRVGAQTAADHLNWSDTKAVLGRQVQIDPSVSLHGTVVLGDHAVVEARTSIEDSIIMPGTYVGTDLSICNAIVAPELLIRVDTGAVVGVDDPLILCDMQRAEVKNYVMQIGNRLAGALLLLLSLPLWPVAALLALLTRGKHALLTQRMISNRSACNEAGAWEPAHYNDWAWDLDIPILRRLPRLLAVIRGDLDLVGRAPRSDWLLTNVADAGAFGLLGPVQVLLPADAPVEERELAESCFVATRSFKGDMKYLLSGLAGLCGTRGWLGRRGQVETGGPDSGLSRLSS